MMREGRRCCGARGSFFSGVQPRMLQPNAKALCTTEFPDRPDNVPHTLWVEHWRRMMHEWSVWCRHCTSSAWNRGTYFSRSNDDRKDVTVRGLAAGAATCTVTTEIHIRSHVCHTMIAPDEKGIQPMRLKTPNCQGHPVQSSAAHPLNPPSQPDKACNSGVYVPPALPALSALPAEAILPCLLLSPCSPALPPVSEALPLVSLAVPPGAPPAWPPLAMSSL